jgi:hypothetical protein
LPIIGYSHTLSGMCWLDGSSKEKAASANSQKNNYDSYELHGLEELPSSEPFMADLRRKLMVSVLKTADCYY